MTVTCPYCNSPAQLVTGVAIYPHRSDLHEKKFYLCPPCGAWVGCHHSTNQPLGRLANAELRQANIAAHAAFDRLWKQTTPTGTFDRSAAYQWLADQLGVPRSECHIGMFDVEQCRLVVAICKFSQSDS